NRFKTRCAVLAPPSSTFRKTLGDLRRDNRNQASALPESASSNGCLERVASFSQRPLRALRHLCDARSCPRALSTLATKRSSGLRGEVLVTDRIGAVSEIIYRARDQPHGRKNRSALEERNFRPVHPIGSRSGGEVSLYLEKSMGCRRRETK